MVDTTELIEIESKPFGKIQVSLKQRIEFSEGLYGFEKEKIFYLLDSEEEGPFYYLQSEETVDLAFILINPYMFKSDYILDISENDLKKLDIKNKNETKDKLLVFAIVTIPDNSQDMTANLLGPVLINTETKKGIQTLSLVEGYTTKHNIIEEMKLSTERENGGG